jgi:amidophosphoribosyltransferase
MLESLSWQEECGLFGIFGRPEAAQATYLGLYALQHRGQEGSGIVASDGTLMREHKGLGLVSQVFHPDALERLSGSIAIGHNRYSTTGSSGLRNVQPILVDYSLGQLAVAHNGNLVNAHELRSELEAEGSIFRTTSDSEVIVHLVARSREEGLENRILDAVGRLRGAFSLLFMTRDRIFAFRDDAGFRPLVLGTLGEAHVVASETCALDILGGSYLREVEPGELVAVDVDGPRSVHRSPRKTLSKCIFEFIYFSRPDSVIFGENVDKIRRRLGHELARESPTDGDMVISVPDSSNTSALGYAQESDLPFELGLIRNHYVGRTFIQPTQNGRDGEVRVKYNPVAGVLRNKRVVVVDDSIVRGSTMRKLVKMLRRAGAAEVHLRIASPPIQYPCYYGIDTPARSELIAATHSEEEIRRYLQVDSLRYLSWQGLLNCVKDPENFCGACFLGNYPVPFEEGLTKQVLEGNSDPDAADAFDFEETGFRFTRAE